MLEFNVLADLGGQLLESPVWDERRESVFLCDIDGQQVHEIGLTNGVRRQWAFSDKVASLGICDSGRLIVALARSVVVFDPETGAQQSLWEDFDELPDSRLNDGKVGPDGAFWVGSMDGRLNRRPISRLYRITSQEVQVIIDGGIEISNGLAWSADGKTMFHSDSRGPWIDRYDFEPESGTLSGRKRIRILDESTGRPDGGACDIEGQYWSAGVSAGVMNRFTRDGRLTARFPVPVPAPTMPCFCGTARKQIALVSHRLNNQHHLSGSVLLADAPVAGAAVSRMKGM